MSQILQQASRQWFNRPADERFTSLIDMRDHFQTVKNESRQVIVPTRRIHALPEPDNIGMQITGPNGVPYNPTHWSFGQLAQLAEAPAGYLRTIPAPIAADCINYGLQFKRNIEDVGVLLRRNSDDTLTAATGPRYGRIWNYDVVSELTRRFGNGFEGDWRVPGEFGEGLEMVTKENTTLFASDRNMFVFLADENNRIEIPNRRNGQPGSLARGFFVWNSEVGDTSLGIGTFLFDFVCQNRMVWGAEDYMEIRMRHTSGAPDKWFDEITPAIEAYTNSSTDSIVSGIELARKTRIEDKLDGFLAERFGKRMVEPLKSVHQVEEDRPIETLWDASNAVTAYARGLKNNDARIKMEREAGKLIKLAA